MNQTTPMTHHQQIARRVLMLPATLTIALALSACAPDQAGSDQVKDINVNVAAAADEKYRTLAPNAGGLKPATRAEIDQEVADYMAENNMMGCAIGITRDHQIAYLQGYGKADKATNRAFTVATPSAIGSISKTLTALGVMALAEDGELFLDQPILQQMDLLPSQMPVGWGNPTVRQVLANVGGFENVMHWHVPTFSDEAGINAFYQIIDSPGLQPRLVYESYRHEAANWSIAKLNKPNYSNVGFTLLGALIDQRTKKPHFPASMRGYERYVWHRVGRGHIASANPTLITAALGTHFRNQDIKNLAHGYHPDGSLLDLNGWGWEGPSGGWVMTIGDLSRLILILQSDAVIPKTKIDTEMRQNFGAYPTGINAKAGLGLELALDGKWFGKGGGIRGYVADVQIWPRANTAATYTWGIAHMCNQGTSERGLSKRLRDLLISLEDGTGFGNTPVEPGALETTNDLATTYEPLIRRMAAQYLANAASPEQAWLLAKRDLSRDPTGALIARHLEAGDVDAALALLPRWQGAKTSAAAVEAQRLLNEAEARRREQATISTVH
ncbi:hypothetical protein C7S18_17025 [Ahniella affigens]|uniref:Beta-lactamase-related domain-containing protein n=1 Tax=Ahniella affigens TaxID=2021234 RepID=A0A2P1PVA7_9GAMM|nr:serine hydrolase domain-containing protein [Ahniella affigens]AVP98779.1 hypothetical protein C7S18_17025 [Ahniella affigens]